MKSDSYYKSPDNLTIVCATNVLDYMAALEAIIVNVTIITITSFQYLQSVPGYEAGIEFVQQRNENIRYHHVVRYSKDIVSCERMGDYHLIFAVEYYYTQCQPSSAYFFMAPRKPCTPYKMKK